MLARASSDAGTRLRRSKSTSTVHRHAPSMIEPLNPDIAQQHAIAAATAAFFRSQPQEPIERKANRSVELSGSKSNASRKSLTSQGSHFPPRALSIRSVPPQSSTPKTSTHRNSTSSAPQPDKLPFVNPGSRNDRPPSSLRPSSAQPSTGFNDNGRPSSPSKSHRYSTASSITSQQIRKARSMYYASSVQTGSPIARPPSKYLTTPPSPDTSSTLCTVPVAYVPTRMIGSSPLAAPQVPVAIANGETIDNARDKYLQGFHQRSVKHKPSLFLAPFKKRQDKSRDKTKRLPLIPTSMPSTDCDLMDSTADTIVYDFMPPQDVRERRSFSGSLKKRIKRVFGRTSEKPQSLPVQQIEASRNYFDSSIALNDDDYEGIPSPSEELLRIARSRSPSSPSLEGCRPHLIRSASRSSSKGSDRSNRSLHSESKVSHISASRVTSWGTSTSGETLTQRAIKRLTVIHEAKDSVGSVAERSDSPLTKRKPLPVPTFTAFRDPIQIDSLMEETTTPPVDPKRVFSALLREIDASKSAKPSTDQPDRTPGAHSDVFESSKTKELHSSNNGMECSVDKHHKSRTSSEQEPLPSTTHVRSVSVKKGSFRSLGQAIRSTIRTVTPGEQKLPSSADELVIDQGGSNTSSPGDPSMSMSDREGRTAIFRNFRLSKKRSAIVPHDTSGETCTPSAEQIELRVAKAKNRWQTPLSESTLSPFTRETDRLYTVTEFAQQGSPAKVDATCELPVSTKSPATQLLQSFETPMSPSIYSRNTDGASILPTDSVLSFTGPHQHHPDQQGGSAVILTSQSVRSYVIGTPSPKRPISTRSSRDWKAWLSHEVSAIETVSRENLVIDEQYNTPSQRHKHDLAHTIRTSQTGSEDTTVVVREPYDTSTPRAQPLRNESAFIQQMVSSSVSQDCLVQTVSTDNNVSSTPESFTSQTQKFDKDLAASTASPALRKNQSTSSSSSSTTQPQHVTPGTARMNDRFPFIDTGKRSSSKSSGRSHQSASPTSSEGSSLKCVPQTEAIYSDLSAPDTASTKACVPTVASKSTRLSRLSKENVMPPSIGGRGCSNVSNFRPMSLQPLSPLGSHRTSSNTVDDSTRTADVSSSKHVPTLVETMVARPSLRITIRPLSPEKLSRRPRSAFDLRNTSPRPASEVGCPALHPKPPSCLSPYGLDPKSGVEVAEQVSFDNDQRDGSATPGQRMADRFLKERKSAAVLERGVRKSTGKIVREDTPAFL